MHVAGRHRHEDRRRSACGRRRCASASPCPARERVAVARHRRRSASPTGVVERQRRSAVGGDVELGAVLRATCSTSVGAWAPAGPGAEQERARRRAASAATSEPQHAAGNTGSGGHHRNNVVGPTPVTTAMPVAVAVPDRPAPRLAGSPRRLGCDTPSVGSAAWPPRRSTAATDPRRFARDQGPGPRRAGAARRGRQRPRGPGLPVLRAARHGQDHVGAHPRQGAQLRAPGRRRAVLRVRVVPRGRARARATTCTSSTPPATTASTRCATSSRRPSLGTPGPAQGVHPRRGPHAVQAGRGGAAEDARGAAAARRVRARHHRPAEGQRHHPQPHPAPALPPAAGRQLAEHVRWVAADAGLDVDDAAIDAAVARAPARPATRCRRSS